VLAQDFDFQSKCSQASKVFFAETKEEYRHGPSTSNTSEIMESISYDDYVQFHSNPDSIAVLRTLLDTQENRRRSLSPLDGGDQLLVAAGNK
jgi:hypothetical protein